MSGGLAPGLIEVLLDRLERLEDPLLSWGITDGRLSEEEVEDAVRSALAGEGFPDDHLDVEDAVDQLEEMGLLVEVEGGWRTRMNEYLHLAAELRQMFPDGSGGPKAWRSAPRLVDGMRYVRRPRRYPLRDAPSAELVERSTRPRSAGRAVMSALTSTGGVPWNLSGFQVRATEQILGQLDRGRGGGTIVGAGTGAGKTLAFYLPAFTYVASELDGPRSTKVLALYPRNELLKDQLQGAVEQARDLVTPLRTLGLRPASIGALFGSVPQSDDALTGRYGWPNQGSTWLCPYLLCPEPAGTGRCRGQLVVGEKQLQGARTSLRCAACGARLSEELFAVTRDQLRASPPDILFSSTEMLSRGLLDPPTQHVFGVGAARPPGLVLLDEVHTYGGTTGAMTALTLRRWRARVRRRPVYVGLSATLLDAQRFFGDLVGERADRIDYVEPSPDELVPEGAEYLAVLRGDPTSQTSLLSTSLQVAMLLGRTMDHGSPGGATTLSEGLFGTKTFLFTDDLDVTNRLYHDLLDAEGQRHRKNGNEPFKPSLAHLRSTEHPETPDRRAQAQVWDLAVRTGHELGVADRLRVGRTTSQDSGVDPLAQVVVATASLEVGVDDDAVGAVIQHKAPRDSAAFLQRKGRAGRKRGTRPVTTVVVSDYGRDRDAYEGWDRLVDPVLVPSGLPVWNTHVLRMQAAMETLAWTAMEEHDPRRLSNLWRALQGPSTWDGDRRAQQLVKRRLASLLDDPAARDSLAKHLARALAVEPGVVDDLLWRAPRPIILGLVPAMVRRLTDGWAVAGSDVLEDHGASQPLPGFIPRTLFSKLALPEVLVDLPARPWDEVAPTESMGVIQAITQLAPGRITKRFAVESDLDRVWVDPGATGTEQLEVRSLVTHHQVDGAVPVGTEDRLLLRPLRLCTSRPDMELNDSSHGRPRWASELVGRGDGKQVPSASATPLGTLVGPMVAFLHRDQEHAEVRRGAYAVDVDLRWRDGREEQRVVTFVDDGQPVAVGAAFDVDALRLRPALPDPTHLWDGSLAPMLRSSLLRHRVGEDAVLLAASGPFVADRLADLMLLAIALRSRDTGLSAQEVWSDLEPTVGSVLAEHVSLVLADPASETDTENARFGGGKLGGELRGALSDATVLERLAAAAPALWQAPDAAAVGWLRIRLLRTVGEAVLEAARLLCPEHDPRGVFVDVEPGRSEDEVWISEEDVGGGGFIEAFVDAAGASPARFIRLVAAALRPGFEELTATALTRTVMAASSGPGSPVAEAFRAYRQADGAAAATNALATVRRAIVGEGVPASPPIVSSIATRLLRVGSDARLDELVARSIDRWTALEAQAGFELPARLWGLVDASTEGRLDARAHERLQSVLWPRGSSVRERRLASYNPFAGLIAPCSDALLALVDEEDRTEVAASAGWLEVCRTLASTGTVTVTGRAATPGDVLDILAESAVTAVDLSYLQLHAEASEVRIESDGTLSARLDLPDVGRFDGPALAGTSHVGGIRTRRINTNGGGAGPVASVLHSLFVSELVQPSSPLWIVSAWLSDVVVVDNRGGELLTVAPGLPVRELRLVEIVTEVVSRGGEIRVVVRDAPHNAAVVGRLREVASRSSVGSLSVAVRPELHHKTIVSDRLLLEGSMNLTFNGAEVNEEGVRIFSEPAEVSRQRMEFGSAYGGLA